MPLESATFIADLDANNPVGNTDDYATADDHLRLTKEVLKNSFGNVQGAVTSNHDDLNVVSGAALAGVTAAELVFLASVTSDIQDQFDNLLHDDFPDYVAAEHINWVASGPEDIQVDRINSNAVSQHEASINHNALQNYEPTRHTDHATVSMIAGAFFSGGGSIVSNRTFNLAFAGETDFVGDLEGTDEFIVNDGGTPKKIKYQETGRPVKIVAGTSYVPVIGDAQTFITTSSSAAVSISIPSNASVPFKVGSSIKFMQNANGQLTFSVSSGTLRSSGGQNKTTQIYSVVTVTKIDTNIWVLEGDKAA